MDYTNEELLEATRKYMERGESAEAQEDHSVHFGVAIDALYETDLWPKFVSNGDACLWRQSMTDHVYDAAARTYFRDQLTALLNEIGELIEQRKKTAGTVLCEVHEGAHIETQRCEYPHLTAPPGREPQVGHPYRVTD